MESVERERSHSLVAHTPVPEASASTPEPSDLPEDEPEPVRRLAPMPEPEVVAEPRRRAATALPDRQMWTICSEVNMITTVIHSHSTHSDGLEDVTTMARQPMPMGFESGRSPTMTSRAGRKGNERQLARSQVIPGIEMTCEQR